MNLTTEKNSPFPLDHKRYNTLQITNTLTVYLPYNKTQPFVFIDTTSKNKKHAFLYADNLERLSIEIFYSFKSFNDIERLIDVADFSYTDIKINLVILDKNKSETFFYKKEKGHNKAFRCYKSNIENQKNIPFWELELDNHNKHLPIEKRKIDGKTIETYYYFDLSDREFYHSFSINDDKPFQITKYFVGEDFFYEKDYLIPSIKNKRTRIYKPTFTITKNNKIIDYEYFINGKDYTVKARQILKFLNIEDPSSHNFTEKEKEYIEIELIK